MNPKLIYLELKIFLQFLLKSPNIYFLILVFLSNALVNLINFKENFVSQSIVQNTEEKTLIFNPYICILALSVFIFFNIVVEFILQKKFFYINSLLVMFNVFASVVSLVVLFMAFFNL
jgi:hypothetical protein